MCNSKYVTKRLLPSRNTIAAPVVAFLIAIGTASFGQAQTYSFTDLGGLPGGNGTEVMGINNAGQVVGLAILNNNTHATEWSGGTIVQLGGGPNSWASAINDSGRIVGTSYYGRSQYATMWSGNSTINLGGLPGSSDSLPQAINNAGQVVGYSFIEPYGVATLWTGGSVIDLGGLAPGGKGSVALGINNAAQIVGSSNIGNVAHATEWSGGSVIDLGGLPGNTTSVAQAINKFGQVVGYSLVGGISYAIEWSGGSIIQLGILPGSTLTDADAINDSGAIVGQTIVGRVPSATLWSGGKVVDLNSVFSGTGWILSGATGINDRGQIVGFGINPLGIQDGFLLTPVPEISTWAMMLVGFAGLGFAAYRRNMAASLAPDRELRHGALAGGTSLIELFLEMKTKPAGSPAQTARPSGLSRSRRGCLSGRPRGQRSLRPWRGALVASQ